MRCKTFDFWCDSWKRWYADTCTKPLNIKGSYQKLLYNEVRFKGKNLSSNPGSQSSQMINANTLDLSSFVLVFFNWKGGCLQEFVFHFRIANRTAERNICSYNRKVRFRSLKTCVSKIVLAVFSVDACLVFTTPFWGKC